MEYFGRFIFGLIKILILLCTGGYVAMKLYNWIIVPQFSVPEITIAVGLGIMVFMKFITSTNVGQQVQAHKKKKWDTRKEFESLFYSLLWQGVSLFIGWLTILI